MKGFFNSHFFKRTLTLCILLVGIGGIMVSVRNYTRVFKTEVHFEQDHKVDPQESVVINFSWPMITSTVTKNLRIAPAEEVNYKWENNNKKLIISPKTYWKLETNYVVSINKARNTMLLSTRDTFPFSTVDYPKMQEFSPKAEAKDIVLDMESPVVAMFDKPLENFKVRFEVNPFVEMASELDPKKTRVRLLPKEELKKGTKYTIAVKVKYDQEEEYQYRKIYESSFETKAALTAPTSSDFNQRLSQALQSTPAQVQDGKYIDINVRTQVMVIFEQGKALDSFLLSTGRRGMETPQGSFQIHNKVLRTWSKKYHLYMPYWMAVVSSGQFGIHELPEWPGGFKEGANHLGIPVSHGCIRLGVGPAERVFNWAEIGTPVVIHS